MAEDDSYPPGTWISKNMSSTFVGKQIRLRKKTTTIFDRWFNLLSNIFFVNMSSSSLNFQGKNKYNKAKQTPMMHWISEIRFRHNINTYNKYLETTMQLTCFFHPKNLQIPKFAFPCEKFHGDPGRPPHH